ncbi:MAG: ABC transporter substrate-binding protein [Hyphomicrobiales bacterium]
MRLLSASIIASLFSVVAALAEPIAVTDPTGHEVKLSGPATRMVAIPIPSSSTVVALDGSTRRLAGMHPLAKSAIRAGILGAFFPEAEDIPSNIINNASSEGFAPNVEAIAALRPDLVVQWGDADKDIIAPLENAGLTTGLILYGTEEKARAIINFLGDVTGNAEKAAALVRWRDETLAKIRPKVLDLPEKKRPRILYLVQAKSSFRASGKDSYNDFYIDLVGGVNAAAELTGIKSVNAEQIAAWNPDVILLNGFEDDLDLTAIYGNFILSETAAAKTKRVYKMPIGGYRWDPPSQESPLTWMWLADLIHPEIFDFNIRAEIASSYQRIYGHAPSSEQVDAILRMPMNGGSAGYSHFASD